ncbi:hypothetical protein PR048_030850 [Dryococelus australis]|uniref:CAF1B/HIR1 beta-propeller domain-containing protein n=1 Tax=Dryococelus australis TaxID=614101 RepID=A0ABQ9GCW2_9NEOP|nr:hypothetical protein PR048_030850 [Dryococelus australis]
MSDTVRNTMHTTLSMCVASWLHDKEAMAMGLMKCTIPEISWHNRDPVLSVDVQCGKEDDFYRLASGGTDSHVVVWHVRVKDNGMAEVNFVADLQRHQRAVNTVRFSPSGELLASGDDESAIIVWKQKTEQDAPELSLGMVETNTEQWVHVKILRGHVEDVYDLCWSPDSTCLMSGSVDNTAILWDVHKGRHTAILSDHKGFVQGVAWDPKNQYVATLSSDRTCRVFNVQTRKVVCRASKASLPIADGHDSELEGKPLRLFYDDTLKSFFRRLAFSPDGELLFAPSGIIESPDTNKHGNATHIFVRRMFNRPVMYLPSPDQYTVAVRCCPTLFQLHDGESMFALPYRIVVAIATQSSVVLYDTSSRSLSASSPIYTTPASPTSPDGYCSMVTFSKGELGEEYIPVKTTAIPTTPTTAVDKQDVSKVCPEESMNSDVETAPVIPVSKKADTTDRNPEASMSEHNKDSVLESAVGENPVKKKLIRRIQPIQLTGKSSPRKPKDGIPCNSSLLKASPCQSISAYFNKTKSNEEDKDKISQRVSTEVKHDSPHKSEVMDVDGDVSVVENNVKIEISSRLVSQVVEDVNLEMDKGEATVPKHGDSVTRRESSVEVPLETSAVADSHTLGISKSVDEVSEQKNQCAVSETVKLVKDECECVEKMDVDEVVEAVSGTSNLLPDKVEVIDESPDKADVMDVSPDKAEVMDELPDKAEDTKELPNKVEVMKELPDKTDVTVESPDKADIMNEFPDKAQVTDESPDKAQVTDESPDKAQATDESPDKAQATDKSPDKAQVTDELRGSKTLEKSHQGQYMLQDSKELKVIKAPENDKASECSVNSSEQNLCCTIDSIQPTANSPSSEHVHKTPRKCTEAGSKPSSSGTETTPGTPVGENTGTATISPALQIKKTPRRVQLITLSSPKSKRNLLQS